MLVFRNDIRGWFELKLDEPQCGQTSIQLIRTKGDHTQLQVLRGCRVQSKGIIDESPTGYYTLDLFQDVEEITAVGSCVLQAPFPDYSHAKPDMAVSDYRVDMYVNYEPGDHPIVVRVTNAGKELKPWHAYASHFLTGGFVLYGYCGEGFVVDKVFGTPQANPSHFAGPRTSDDRATFDAEGAAGIKHLTLTYTCVRPR